ncbi:MAG: alpha/beta fold hydrolase [Pseudomonadota bacterium]
MQLNYTKTGDLGSVILILHGLFGNARNWQNIASYLSKNNQVYSLDLRNHGLSAHSEDMTYQHMAEDVLEFITAHKLGKVNLLGHSMGGKVVMHLALNYPEIVKKLIVADIAPVTYPHTFSAIFTGLTELPLEQLSSRKQAEDFLLTTIKEQGVRKFLLQNLCLKSSKNNSGINGNKTNKKNQENYWRFNLPVLRENIGNIVAFPNIPIEQTFLGKTLFLSGHESDYINDSNRKQIKNYFPSAKIVTVKGAGHWLHFEKPEVVKNILSIFLSS